MWHCPWLGSEIVKFYNILMLTLAKVRASWNTELYVKSTYFEKSKNFESTYWVSSILQPYHFTDFDKFSNWNKFGLNFQWKYRILHYNGIIINVIEISYLLWGNIEISDSQINFLININTGDNEEDTGTSGSSWEQSTKSEDDGPLILLLHRNN